MEQSIHAQIRQEWQGFIDDRIEIVEGYTFNQYDTIKKIHLYLNSQFESAKKYHGRRKMFFNISKYRAAVATRMLNFDTKDLRLVAEDFESSLKGFLLEKEFRVWLKSSVFAGVLNSIAEEVPRYGSFVLRKVPGKVEEVDLRRMAMDTAVERIWQSPFIVLKKYLTASEIKKQKAWDPSVVKALLSRPPTLSEIPSYEDDRVYARGSGGRYYEIFERYGDVPKSWLTGKESDSDETVRSFYVTAESCAFTDKNPMEMGMTLFKGEWLKAWPFWDFHYDKTKGRWLGVGVIEDLFVPQERENELTNQKRLSMEISSMHLFQTNGQTVLQNLLKDARPGDVFQIPGTGTISAIATENRDLSSFSTEEQRFDQQADRLSFAYDTTRGEGIGKSTPATNAVIQNNSANGVFDFKKENIGIALRFFLLDWVLPELVTDLNKEHIMRFTGSLAEMRRLDDVIVDTMARDAAMERLLSGNIVTEDEKHALDDQIRSQLGKRGGERFLKIIQGFYKDVKVDFDFIITNEQKDLQAVSGNIFQILTAVSQNPAILQNPLTKSLLKKYAEMIGIPAVELDFADAEATDSQQRDGGAMPQRPGVPELPPGMAGQGQGAPRGQGAPAEMQPA